ncbi:major facilitator superfamily domain-containing protein [Talaromyces proteolyticus]|uniref:Major facilitator superfamily domain-containing protein n=1 Tax=Talaromyces proteolyticus TaxID=1131652 RepID=A0AAD4KJF2_9EURO|nr:major facilitator superfamily domain-containing protein [Talaromyces proteolyticus]KAH8689663.1 major facilitator superfamily domain-containing protein [Talaromyces proteolyticus]
MKEDLPIPGTVQQVDVNHSLHLRHGTGQDDIVLIPQPSQHPDDPLNWSYRRKMLNSCCQMAWCFFAAALISGLSPAYLLISEDTGISVADLSTGNGIMYLFMGWGTLLTQNLAQNWGRRPVLVVGMLGASLMTIWSTYVKSVGEWYANRVLIGLFISPQEALIELCIADVHFTHNRGLHMGIYNWTLWCGAFLAPIAGGFVADSMGWRWIQYLLAIICLCITLGIFLGFEDTMFFRKFDRNQETVIPTEFLPALSAEAEKGPSSQIDSSNPPISSESGEIFPVKTYLQKLKMWGLHNPKQPYTFWQSIYLSFRLLLFPTQIFSGLLVGSILAWYNVLGGSLAEVLGGAPYNFTADQIGLTYFASVIGVSVGCYCSGWLSDILAIRLARRRQGIKEPEDRLWMAIIAIIAHPLGCILYGVGASHHIPWIGVVIGIAFMCLTLPMGSGLAITYIIDCQKELAAESIVTIILIRNTIGFAFAYAVNPMISNMGLQNTFILIAVLGIVFWSACFLWIGVGKSARKSIAKSYWTIVEKHGLTAH